MKRITLLTDLHVGLALDTEECVIQPPEEVSMENKLHEHVMCNYNGNVPPPPLNNTDSIEVSLRFVFKKLHFLSEDQVFSAYMWTFITWNDERLKWNASDFDGIDDTAMSNFKIWIPGIKLYNSVDDQYDQSYVYVPCKVDMSGDVQCFYWITFRAKCATDLNDWPYDTQVCSLHFGPWAAQGAKVRLDIPARAVTFIESKHSAEWDVVVYKQEEDPDAEIQVKLNFTLARHGNVLGAVIIPPSIVLSILTISALFVDARSGSRLFLLCFSLACHFYFLSELAADIPRHSNDPPRILLYFRGSIIVNFISIALTILLKVLCKREAPVPNFIVVGKEFVYQSYGKFVVFPRWGCPGEDDKSGRVRPWIELSNLLNSFYILIIVMAYIIIFCVFVPTPSNIRSNVGEAMYYFQ